MLKETLAAMRRSIIDGAPDAASTLAQQALADGVAPSDAINDGYVPGMHDVGEQFARGQMFLPDMMASAEAMRAAMAVLDPELRKLGTERPVAGVVVLGTTKGDIHEIGKILVGTMLTANGFRVHDLGVDVAGRKVCRQGARAEGGHRRRFSASHDYYAQSEGGDGGVAEGRTSFAGESDGRRSAGNPPLGRRNRRRRLCQRRHERCRAGATVNAAEAAVG